jgi:hypothetical protein
MNKGKLILGALALLVVFMAPATVVRAGPGVSPLVHLSFCGEEFYFGSDDYPNLYFDHVDVYDSAGTFVETINLFGHNAETRDVGYVIGRIVARWGQSENGAIYEYWADTPSCVGTKLIDMYVYYSSNPFFGNTHTLTIYSAKGFPSKDVVTALAGGRLPDGFEYGVPACWGALYDNGTDKGWFECDGYLASVGERRANLRNDPEGADFDLLPKIEKYLEMLKRMGETPQSP